MVFHENAELKMTATVTFQIIYYPGLTTIFLIIRRLISDTKGSFFYVLLNVEVEWYSLLDCRLLMTEYDAYTI